MEYFWNKCQQADASLRPVLETLHHLYGLWSLEKHMSTLYEAGYSSEPSLAQLVREAILELCLRLKPEAVAIVDALAPPDFVTNSILGRADGRVKSLLISFYKYGFNLILIYDMYFVYISVLYIYI